MPKDFDQLLYRLRSPCGIGAPSDHDTMEEAAKRIEELEAECFKLAAGVCEYRSGNDHGNPLCLKTNQLI